MDEFNPHVSIIIPVYNGSNYLAEAIRSAGNQTYGNREILVIDDGSTDNTGEIARSFGEKISYFKKENGGQSSALNFGIRHMKGDYFSWLSHDDLYVPEKINLEIDLLRTCEDKYTIPYSDYDLIDRQGSFISKRSCAIRYGNILTDLLMASPLNGCTLLIHKDIFSKEGGFNEQRPHTSDVEFFFNLARKYAFRHVPVSLVKMRVHEGQATTRNLKYHFYESNLFLIDSVRSLTDEEIRENTGKSRKEFHKQLALNWSKRGYRKAFRTVVDSRDLKLLAVCYLNFTMKWLRTRAKRILGYA